MINLVDKERVIQRQDSQDADLPAGLGSSSKSVRKKGDLIHIARKGRIVKFNLNLID